MALPEKKPQKKPQLRRIINFFSNPQRQAVFLLALTLITLILIYLPTLLTQVTGGVEVFGKQNPYIDDVAEIQVALNVWGTVHYSGYPLYTMIGNVVTRVYRVLGVNPAAAVSLYAMTWGVIALSLFYVVVYHLTGKAYVAAAATLVLGLARSVWIHDVIAEVYSMALAIEVLLLAIALWRPIATAADAQWRIWLLALVGGIGVAHHRTIALMAPGLLLAVWPGLRMLGRRVWIVLGIALVIGLLGFLPYIYLPARALAHADWVYGNPGTLSGFWREFTGAEAGWLMHLPANGQAWIDDIVDTFRILATELTLPLFIGSGLSLLWAMFWSRFKREARIAFVCSLGFFAFLFALHSTVMPQAVAMPIVLMLVLGLAFGLDGLTESSSRVYIALAMILGRNFAQDRLRQVLKSPYWQYLLIGVFALIAVVLLIPAQFDFIYTLTHDTTGQTMIALAKHVPREAGHDVFMLPWGPRYAAVAFSKYVTGENADLPLVTHNADFGALAARGDIIFTARDTFYQFPLSWWDQKMGHVYLSSAGDGLISIRTRPLTQVGNEQSIGHGVVMHNYSVCASEKDLHLTITWGAAQKPDADLSVFVKLLQGDAVVAQADSNAPVYGQYPTMRWSQDEVVYDNYVLPRTPGATDISFGMYLQQPSGEFTNYGVTKVPLSSILDCSQ